MNRILFWFLFAGLMSLAACNEKKSISTPPPPAANDSIAPGAPGVPSHWSYAGKTGIGTAYETYTDGAFKDSGRSGFISKVWFSIAQGIVTETMFGLIHEAQLQEMQFYVVADNGVQQEKLDTISSIDYLDKDEQGRPLSLAYKIINKDKAGRYEIEKHIFTDPDSNSLMMKVFFRSFRDNVKPFLYINPNMANSGIGDKAWREGTAWYAADHDAFMSIKTDATIVNSTVGFEGISDGLNEIKQHQQLTHNYNATGDQTGNVALSLQLPSLNKNETGEWTFVLGFGHSSADSLAAATKTLSTGYQAVLDQFNGKGDAVGWEDYLASLTELTSMATSANDGGKLLFASAMVLKAQEDKSNAGAMIASLSNPWGDTMSADQPQTGYKAVWPRDFYQVTMALLALGDTTTPKVALAYLQHVQASQQLAGYTGTPGWFLQKNHVDGTPEWVSVQLDQTAMPIMLAWRLWKHGVLTDADAIHWYDAMLKPAADFLCDGGKVSIGSNTAEITPPKTQQERWEEQGGFSPSTIAAEITGLAAAADLAKLKGDAKNAARYLATADRYSAMIEKVAFTEQGVLNTPPANGKYFLRITANDNPNDQGKLEDRNGQGNLNESEILDAGFLELVRYGVRRPQDKFINETLPEIDNTQLPDNLRVKYNFSFPQVEGSFPGWRRYGNDGYGEDTLAGRGYGATGKMLAEGRGRVWPIFTGERGHYELANAIATQESGELEKVRNTYIKAMELFANQGYMLPEQVWDGVGANNTYGFVVGQGTNSATPLAWSHAEYIKLLRSFRDKKIWDNNESTAKRYGSVKR